MHVRSSPAIGLVVLALVATSLPAMATGSIATGEPIEAATLPDLSGLAPIAAGHVIAVHDSKNPDEDERPRVSLLTLTGTPQGVTWEPVEVAWPEEGGPSNDLESATAIPGRLTVIFAESGDDGSDFQRLFFAEIDPVVEGSPVASITDVLTWPQPAFNVESMAVADVDGETILLYAERAQGQPSTLIRWAPLALSPVEIGEPTSVLFTSPAVQGPGDRPISAMEVGPDGTIYVASSFDPGSDDGPYSSSVWKAGWVARGPSGPEVLMAAEPELVATLDGFKTESLAFIEGADGVKSLYAGTDDENFGGVLRLLPLD